MIPPAREGAANVGRGTDLAGCTALVTGATSGIGREVARVLASRGARVLVGARDSGTAERVIRSFASSIGETGVSRCRAAIADLSRRASAAELAAGLAVEAPAVA